MGYLDPLCHSKGTTVSSTLFPETPNSLQRVFYWVFAGSLVVTHVHLRQGVLFSLAGSRISHGRVLHPPPQRASRSRHCQVHRRHFSGSSCCCVISACLPKRSGRCRAEPQGGCLFVQRRKTIEVRTLPNSEGWFEGKPKEKKKKKNAELGLPNTLRHVPKRMAE